MFIAVQSSLSRDFGTALRCFSTNGRSIQFRLQSTFASSDPGYGHLSAIAKVGEELQLGVTSSVELLAECERRMAAIAPLNAFVQETQSLVDARQAALASDQRRAKKQSLGPLDGIPIAVKDNFCVAGVPSSAGSRALQQYIPPYDATLVARLKEQGAVILGKTNMDEFGMGSFNLASRHGPCVSPWAAAGTAAGPLGGGRGTRSQQRDGREEEGVKESECNWEELAASPHARVAGGSSGGSAVAVSTGCVLGALGSDTGGSVRLPAAWTGVVGLKPSYGALSRWGLIAYASSLDCPGVFGNTVADARLMFQALAGPDPLDAATSHQGTTGAISCRSMQIDTASQKPLQGLKVGVPREYLVQEVSEGAQLAWSQALDTMAKLGAEVRGVSLPHTRPALAAYYIIAPAEAASNLARYEGVRYGVRSGENPGGSHDEGGDVLKTSYARTRSLGFGSEVQRRLLVGTYALSSEMVGPFFQQAQKVRQCVVNDFKEVFTEVDILLTPAAPGVAPLVSSASSLSPAEACAVDVMTVPASLAGLPALTLPWTKEQETGLPLGVQLIAPRFQEETVLMVGEQLMTQAN